MNRIIKWFKNLFDIGNDKCFEQYKNEDGICYGVVGGTKNTGYLAEFCIGCKHRTMYVGKGE